MCIIKYLYLFSIQFGSSIFQLLIFWPIFMSEFKENNPQFKAVNGKKFNTHIKNMTFIIVMVLSISAGWPVTMTTEASSETEVKEKAEESAAQTDQSEKATVDTQEVANAEGEVKGKEKEGKGISRYLPTWLKKQKSQSQVIQLIIIE